MCISTHQHGDALTHVPKWTCYGATVCPPGLALALLKAHPPFRYTIPDYLPSTFFLSRENHRKSVLEVSRRYSEKQPRLLMVQNNGDGD